MTLDEAKAAVSAGAYLGDVYTSLAADDDRAALKEWFVRAVALPSVAGRKAPPKTPATPAARAMGFTGSVCGRCQGMRMVRTGPCETCADCGTTSGGCG